MSIPLPDMLRALRFREHERRITSARSRGALRVWAFLARRPRLYQGLTGIGVRVLAGLARGRGRLRSLPLAAGWTASRDLPAPQGETFMARWRKR